MDYFLEFFENKYFVSFAILVASVILKFVYSRFIFRGLQNTQKFLKIKIFSDLLDSFNSAVRLSIMTTGIYLAILYGPYQHPDFINFVSKIFRSLIILYISKGFYNLFNENHLIIDILRKSLNVDKNDKVILPLMTRIVRVFIWMVSITIIMEEWGYNIYSLITGLGIGGLAIALAAQDTLSNIFAGVMIFIDKPFQIGDWIKTSSVEGVVEDISFRSTRVRTFDNSLVSLPNSKLINEAIVNWNKMHKRRVKYRLGVTYSTSSDQMKKVIQKIKDMLIEHDDVLNDYMLVNFESFAASSLDILIYYFCRKTDYYNYMQIQEEVNFKILEILESEGVSVAFPSRSVYIEANEEKPKI